MHFLHRRVKLKFFGSRARHFRASPVASRFFETSGCLYGPRARAGVRSQHLRIPNAFRDRIGLSTNLGASLREWCTLIERYPHASAARDGISDGDALRRFHAQMRFLVAVAQLSGCRSLAIPKEFSPHNTMVSRSRVCQSFAIVKINRSTHCITSYRLRTSPIATMSHTSGDYLSKVAKYYRCFESSKK